MKILAITDLHDKRLSLERILADAGSVDVILLGGDITNFGGPKDAARLVDVATQTGIKVLAVAGNCDSPQIDQQLVDLGISLHARGVLIGNVGFHGVSAMPPWHSGMYHFTEEQITGFLRVGREQVAGAKHVVVLSHFPPRNGQVDRTFHGDHVGSTSLQAYIETTHPCLVFCGHIHEGRGIERLDSTTLVNCGLGATGSYALAELGEELTVDLREAPSAANRD